MDYTEIFGGKKMFAGTLSEYERAVNKIYDETNRKIESLNIHLKCYREIAEKEKLDLSHVLNHARVVENKINKLEMIAEENVQFLGLKPES